MFYALSKTLDLAFSPLFHGLLLAVLSAIARRRARRKLAVALGAAAWLALYLPATGWLARSAILYVQAFDGPRMRPGVTYDAVILLGGFVRRHESGAFELSEAADRLLVTFQLLQSKRAKRVIIAGGSDRGEAESTLAATLLREAGIDGARMLLDQKSRNTRENAVEVRALLAPSPRAKLLLVTSAFHMQRALGCMRAVGLYPDALATDHLEPALHGTFDLLAPRAEQLRLTELALRELAGRAVYWLRGYTK